MTNLIPGMPEAYSLVFELQTIMFGSDAQHRKAVTVADRLAVWPGKTPIAPVCVPGTVIRQSA
jgi:hypothetical protein